MKALNILVACVLVFALIIVSGCSLFKNTTKSKTKNKEEITKQGESTKLNLKTANKETNIYTYWNDSILYQHQNIREQIDQVKLDKSKAEEKQLTTKEQTIKKTEPVRLWVFAGAAIIFIGLWLAYKRFFRS